jgi:diacylglycerol kinase (ATP)
MPRPRPPRLTGLAHLLAAIRAALAGVRKLWGEAAFRQESALALAVVGAFVLSGVPGWAYAVFAALFLMLVAVEALNTAIERIVDRLSPDWSEFARDAKDLAGLAVACVILVITGFVAWVLWRAWFG